MSKKNKLAVYYDYCLVNGEFICSSFLGYFINTRIQVTLSQRSHGFYDYFDTSSGGGIQYIKRASAL